jgi:hypothetical protein
MKPAQNRRVQDASIGVNTSKSTTTIGKGRQRGVAGTANRIEVLSDQPSMSVPAFATLPKTLRPPAFVSTLPTRTSNGRSPSSRLPMKVESTVTVIAGAAAGGLIAAPSASAAPAFRVCRRKILWSMPALTGNMPEQISTHPVRHQSGQMCSEPVQFRCRAALRRPIDACLDAAARGTAKPSQPQCHLSEQRRNHAVTIVFRPTNPIAAGANRPPDRVLSRLRGGDLAVNPREQLFRFREGQSQIGDVAEVIRLTDLHDVHAGSRVPVPPTSKSTPRPTPGLRAGAKISGTHWLPQFCASPFC